MQYKLLEAYRQYYETHETPADPLAASLAFRWLSSLLRISFPASLKAYQLFQETLHGYWKSALNTTNPDEFEKFSTSGTSSNKPRRYHFGPRPQDWIGALWTHMMYPFGWRPIARLATNVPYIDELQIHPSIEGLYQWHMQIRKLNPAAVSGIIEFLKKTIHEYGAATFSAIPEAHLYLTRVPAWLDFVESQRDRLNIWSWRWEPFFQKSAYLDRGVWIGDFMVDWPTGLNFHTCRHGYQHVLPIFTGTTLGRLNMLNLVGQDVWENDKDLFDVTDIVKCSCGPMRPVYRYLPRTENAITGPDGRVFFDLTLPERLRSRYRSLQFIQHGNTVTIYYDADGKMEDTELLTETLAGYGLQTAWIPEPRTTVGGKRIPFFRPKVQHDS